MKALMSDGSAVYKALKVSEVKPGEFVAVIGAAADSRGHLAVQYAKAMGMRVIALDSGEDNLERCLSLGAEYLFIYLVWE